MLLLFTKYGWKELLFFSLLWSGLAASLWLLPPVARALQTRAAQSVHIDGAALQNHVRIKSRDIEHVCDACRHNFIEIEWRIFVSPCVVIPIDDGKFRFGVARQENRPVIAAPGFVRRNEMK